MLKVKDVNRRRHLARINSQENLIRGVGSSSKVSEDFVLPPDWTTEDGGTVMTSKVCLRYHSPAGQYYDSLAAIQKFLTCSGTTAGDADVGSGLSMDESGLEYFPPQRKGRRLEAILEESTTSIGQQQQPENCLFITELRAFTTFLEELSAQRKCTAKGCLGILCLCLWTEQVLL